ncbi:N-acetyltransferase family protein [uncultured Kriegella sp.]|uniref:GNAT family N-acetyltransferase n=1 Tax=uncultured Kriegella sp. TaxID=1798910 RepID=UPI0030DCBA02|tara:strand:+ start:24966 stop:25454 length:489 start_codon:yes stop_codon:yes gene_type:complete
MIREMIDHDSSRVLEIYQMGLDTKNATFETAVPTWNEWNLKHLKHSRFVYLDNDKVVGWIALSPVSERLVYEGVAEVSTYIDTNRLGKGIGLALMDKMITSSEEHGIWTLFSSVFPENKATLKIHDKFGFRTIGIREKIAKLDDKWRDTILLERRSRVVGLS